MNKAIIYSGGYQAVNFILLFVQAVLLPRHLGLEQYGVGLYLLIPVLFLGGLWEPIVQRFCIAGDGIPSAWWKLGGPIVLLGYVAYFYFLLPTDSRDFYVLLLGVFFLIEYIFSIYCIAVLQSRKSYSLIFALSLSGLILSALTLIIGSSYWLVCIFYSAFFFPVFICGIFSIRKSSNLPIIYKNSLGGVLDAISTRLFYVLINNFYVILIGVFFGPVKAAVFRIVVSFSSALRFFNPLSIGHFYSMIHGVGFRKKIEISFIPLMFFYIGVLLLWLLLPFLTAYGQQLLGGNYRAVLDFFVGVLWFIPLYLWSPYLSIVFFASLGWKNVFVITILALLFSGIFIYFNSMELFFGSACVLYCSSILIFGIYRESISRDAN